MPKKPPAPTPGKSPWAPPAVQPEDLEGAKREALLQLKIGRSAHLAAILGSVALAIDAVLLLFEPTTLPVLHGSDVGAAAVAHTYFLILPIVAGVGVAAVVLASKWEAFQFWPWEPHFAVSVGAFGLSLVTIVLFGLRVAGAGATGHLALYPGFVPLSLVVISAALFGATLTWSPWAARQWTSAVAALAPIATTGVLYVHPAGSAGSSEVLAVALLVSAILYQTSGSFLHLVSSGTAAHEQTVITTGQSRLVKLATDLQQRDETIRFREAALVKREAEAEAAEAAVRRGRDAQTERQAELDRLETDQRGRTETLAVREREVAGREAAFDVRARSVEERAKEVALRSEQLSRQAPELAAREQRLSRAEGELTRREVQLKQRAQELDRREATTADGESRVTSRRKEIERKTADLLRREGEVTAREHALGSTAPAPSPGRAVTITDLSAREAQLHNLKATLEEQNAQLGRRAKDISDQAKTSASALHQIAEHRAHLASRETELSQREADLDERLKVADERRLEFETALRDYQHRLEELGQQHISAAQKGADLDRSLHSLADRERVLEERATRLRDASAELDRREGEVVLRERAVDADEAEVSLRRQEIARGEDLPFAGLLAVAAADRAEADASSRRPVGRRRLAGGSADDATRDTGALTASPTRKYPDRLPTGTPRLDDLLLGGLPPKSHVALVGDAFSGKEVALYAFVAEGLKRSEPAVLVTASRSAAEVSESLGIVLPQFRGYEQMGNVTWVDASGSGAASGPHRLVAKSSDDRAGILTALVQAAKTVEESTKGGAFRVAFLGLSAVIAHADERASFSFLQNVVGILKPRNALAMYALEAGALSEAQVESLLGRMDGAIVFRQDRDRTYLSVKGFGDVATRDWVEVRATSRALVIGSFALERIR